MSKECVALILGSYYLDQYEPQYVIVFHAKYNTIDEAYAHRSEYCDTVIRYKKFLLVQYNSATDPILFGSESDIELLTFMLKEINLDGVPMIRNENSDKKLKIFKDMMEIVEAIY